MTQKFDHSQNATYNQSKATKISKQAMGKLFAVAQNFVPQTTISQMIGDIAKSHNPRIKTSLIKAFAKTYNIRLDEYARDFKEYDSFNDFFTRELKPHARPIDIAPTAIVSPADGTVSQIGDIDNGQIIQAKKRWYSTGQLLANAQDEKYFDGGKFATIYLAPSNYHRVHMPFDGVLTQTRYIPGNLFSVNHTTASHIPDLFARNERLVCVFDTDFGRACVVLVGAMIVAGIECVATGKISRTSQIVINEHQLPLKKGDELGRFYLGSTAIVVLPKNSVLWADDIIHGTAVKIGEKIGQAIQATQHDSHANTQLT